MSSRGFTKVLTAARAASTATEAKAAAVARAATARVDAARATANAAARARANAGDLHAAHRIRQAVDKSRTTNMIMTRALEATSRLNPRAEKSARNIVNKIQSAKNTFSGHDLKKGNFPKIILKHKGLNEIPKDKYGRPQQGDHSCAPGVHKQTFIAQGGQLTFEVAYAFREVFNTGENGDFQTLLLNNLTQLARREFFLENFNPTDEPLQLDVPTSFDAPYIRDDEGVLNQPTSEAAFTDYQTRIQNFLDRAHEMIQRLCEIHGIVLTIEQWRRVDIMIMDIANRERQMLSRRIDPLQRERTLDAFRRARDILKYIRPYVATTEITPAEAANEGVLSLVSYQRIASSTLAIPRARVEYPDSHRFVIDAVKHVFGSRANYILRGVSPRSGGKRMIGGNDLSMLILKLELGNLIEIYFSNPNFTYKSFLNKTYKITDPEPSFEQKIADAKITVLILKILNKLQTGMEEDVDKNINELNELVTNFSPPESGKPGVFSNPFYFHNGQLRARLFGGTRKRRHIKTRKSLKKKGKHHSRRRYS